jgi:hypothetical protein
LEWLRLVYVKAIRYFLRPFGKLYGHLVNYMGIWYTLWSLVVCVFSHFGILCQEKSGNPDRCNTDGI